jgi:hypothetical protein
MKDSCMVMVRYATTTVSRFHAHPAIRSIAMSEMRDAYRILVGKDEGKRRLWRSVHRSEDNTAYENGF